jgi:hypothetical protein
MSLGKLSQAIYAEGVKVKPGLPEGTLPQVY